ncbi:MAG: N-acetylneuraminate synthase family protein [Bacteroidota bacterium]|nr:N-acetylneuraminate synthase family protein [Bacteroidota bacterium]
MFVISEISPQFGGIVEVAEQMILQSKLAGADAIKVQLYTETQFGAERAYLSMSFDQLKRLKQYADTLNIPLFATPFTQDRLDWCIDLKLPYLKVAARMHAESPDLVEKIMSYNIPTFVSIPSDYDVNKVKKYDHAIYLYCVVKYPTRVDEFSMPDFKNSIFHGISDHTLGVAGALYASAHGAQYLEKHYTLQHSFQFETEKAHLGAMDMNQLTLIKNTAKEFEMIQKVLAR